MTSLPVKVALADQENVVELLEMKRMCGLNMYVTGVEGIFILDIRTQHATPPIKHGKLDPMNIVTSRFVQAKAGFVFRKLQLDFYEQYAQWFIANCYIENEIWKIKIKQLVLHPEYSGFSLLNRRKGVLAKSMGDVVYLMECKHVHVPLGVPKYCTKELPVLFNSSEYYLLPESHVLTKRANKIPCSLLTPVVYKVDGIWYLNNGKTLRMTKAPKKLPSTIFEHSLKKFDDIRVKNFDQNGLYNSEELKKSHAMFFQAHDIQLVNEDIGAGILHGDNAYSYDLAPVSSSTGFVNWARKTCDQFLGRFSFLAEGLVYMILVIIVLIVLVTLKKAKTFLLNAFSNE